MLYNCKGSKGHLCPNCQRRQDHPSCTIQEAKLLALWPSGILRPRGPPSQVTPVANMAKSCKTWRSKSSKRKADAKVTCSLLARLPYMPAGRAQRHAGGFLPSFVGVGLYIPPFTLLQRTSPVEEQPAPAAPPAPVPKQSPRPKRWHPPQILWAACLWTEPHPRQPWKSYPAPKGERSHPGIGHSSGDTQKHSARTLTW